MREPIGADVAPGQAVEWTGDDGRIGCGHLLWLQDEAGEWATVECADGQLQAVPAASLRVRVQAGQLRLI